MRAILCARFNRSNFRDHGTKSLAFVMFLFSVVLCFASLSPFVLSELTNLFVKAQLPRPGDVLRYRLRCFDLSLHGG